MTTLTRRSSTFVSSTWSSGESLASNQSSVWSAAPPVATSGRVKQGFCPSRTLYCAKANYDFGISRVIKSLEPYNKKVSSLPPVLPPLPPDTYCSSSTSSCHYFVLFLCV